MRPAETQIQWRNSTSFDLKSDRDQVEAYSLRAHDPSTGRAFWVQLALFGDKKRRGGSVRAIYLDPMEQKRFVAGNRFDGNRILLDPVRPGAGIGESLIEEGTASGIVRGDGFTLNWTLHLTPSMPAYRPLPSQRLYRGSLLPTKHESTMPLARVSGAIEVWTNASKEGEHTRDAAESQIRVDGWTASVGHSWGTHYPDRFAWASCTHFTGHTEPASFELYGADMRVGRVLHLPTTLGRLQLGHHLYRFDTFRTLRTAQSAYGPDRWVFELDGPDGALSGRISARECFGMMLDGPHGKASHGAVSPVADLELTLRPRSGAVRQLTSRTAMLEVGQTGDRGGVDVVF